MRTIDCHHPSWAKRRMPSGIVVCSLCTGTGASGPFEAEDGIIETEDDDSTFF